MSTIQHFINGEFLSDSARTADVYNPSTGKVIHQVPLASRETIQKAIDSAKAAFPAWRNTPPAKRAQVMFRFKQLLEQNEARISQLISEEHGKTLEDAAGELKRGIENVEYACSAPEILKGEYSRNVGPNIDAWSDFQPLGVVAGITPFNFPAMVPLWMYPLAIVCGNCFILKPSERDPSSTLFIAQLLHEAGLPKGVLSVVHGDKGAVDALIEAPEVKALSFVGSTPIAEYIYAEGTKRGKRVQALGGAKNHAVLMPDADLEEAVRGTTVNIRVPTLVNCKPCDGSGAKKGSSPVTCTTCGGIGQVRMQQGFFAVQQTCPRCHGQGKVISDPCESCRGEGRVEEYKTLSVKVPAGVDTGDRIRLSGEGEAGVTCNTPVLLLLWV